MADALPGTTARGARAFWVLWCFSALVGAVVVFFFLWGLADGSVSSFNMAIWLVMLAGVGMVVFRSLGLRRAGRAREAVGLLLMLAIPGLAYTIFLLAAVLLGARWN